MLFRSAFYDALTKLPNRRLFLDRLDQALTAAARNGGFGALLFIDLDQFKCLNDLHGHITGDELLVEVARRLSLCVRRSDTVVRLGGDEFVVMLLDLETGADGREGAAAEATAVAEKIRVALAENYLLRPATAPAAQAPLCHRCTASIGISLFTGDSDSPEDLIKHADMAMYEAKAAGRNAIRLFGAPAAGA